jgi:hypothetical protein
MVKPSGVIRSIVAPPALFGFTEITSNAGVFATGFADVDCPRATGKARKAAKHSLAVIRRSLFEEDTPGSARKPIERVRNRQVNLL